MKRILWLCLIMISVITACGTATDDRQEAPGPTVQQTKPQQSSSMARDPATKAKLMAQQDKRVDAAAAVAIEKELSVALKVSNFNRLYLKDIRQSVHGELTHHFPAYTVHVSTDSKLFSELETLQKDMRNTHPPKSAQKEKYKKRLKKINEDMKG